MSILLGPHTQRGDYLAQNQFQIVGYVEYAPTDLMRGVKNRGGFNWARKWVDESHLKESIYSGRPEQAAQEYFDAALPMVWDAVQAKVLDCLGSGNEIFGGDRPSLSEMGAYYRFETHFTDLCHAASIKSGVALWPSGNIELRQWDYLLNRCAREGRKFLGDVMMPAEYWPTDEGPYGPDLRGGMAWDRNGLPNLIGRFFCYDPPPPVEVVIRETGFDNYQGGAAKLGWRAYYKQSNRDEVYAKHIREYAELITALAEEHKITVVGATPFTWGFNEEWTKKQFDYTNVYEIVKLFNSWARAYTIYEEEVYPMPVEFWGRFADMKRERPEACGEPIGPIVYPFGPKIAVQASDKGLFVYDGRDEAKGDDKDVGIFIPATLRRSATAETEDISPLP